MDTLEVGARVKIEGYSQIFEVLEGPSQRNEYLVGFGSISLRLPRKALQVISDSKSAKTPPKLSQREKKLRKAGRISQEFEPSGAPATVDLHGLTAVEARERLELALSAALLQDAAHLDVIHGVGSGVLRSTTHEYLKKSRAVKRFELLAHNAGTTRAYL